MKKITFVLGLMFLMINVVYADSIILSCPDKISGSAEFSCQLSGSTGSSVSSISARIGLSDGLSLVGFIPQGNWQGDGGDGKIELYTDNFQTGTFSIGTIKVRNSGNSDATVVINSVFFYDENESEKAVNGASSVVKVVDNSQNNTSNATNNASNNNTTNNNNGSNNNSNNGSTSSAPSSASSSKPSSSSGTTTKASTDSSCYLIDLKITGYTLDFEKRKTEYELKISDESSLKITPVLEDSNATYEILGNDDLKNNSVIRVQVTGTDGNIETYRITILKDDKPKNYSMYFIVIIAILVLINIVRIIVSEKKKLEVSGNE